MDWLADHDSQVECKVKKVKLKAPNGDEVVFREKRQEKKSLSIMQVKRMLRQGCEAYIAHVVQLRYSSG